MTDGAIVGFVIATRNRPALLARALDSIAAQSGVGAGAIDVVVVDDAGDESASAVVAAFRARASDAIGRVQLLRNGSNEGRSRSRNTGIAALGAAWIGFLDDDDLLHPDHVRLLLDAVPDGGAVIPYGGSQLVTETADGAELERTAHDDGGEFREDLLLLRNLFPIQAALVPRALLLRVEGFEESLDVLEDWDLWLRLTAHASFQRVDAVTSEYRHRPGAANSVTRERARHIADIATVYERHPVTGRADAETLHAMRDRVVERASAGLDAAWRYDRSVLAELAPGSGPSDLVALIVSVVEEQDALGGTWQLVLALPRDPALDEVLAAVDGDIELLRFDADSPPGDPRAMLRRHATGRVVDAARLSEGA